MGKKIAELCKEKSISKVCFDRGGFIYHGRIQVCLATGLPIMGQLIAGRWLHSFLECSKDIHASACDQPGQPGMNGNSLHATQYKPGTGTDSEAIWA